MAAMFPISPSAARGFSEGPVPEQALPPRSVLAEAKRFCRNGKKDHSFRDVHRKEKGRKRTTSAH
ncbi:hypothetical protein INR49_023410 [Caranx melampygus]|nr:hypothetical protein INR49_023410 [Caranx melampygus]